MAHVIFKIFLTVFLCLFFITFVAKDAIASFFIDENILDETCYSSLDNEYLCDEVSIFPEESPMDPICNLIQTMYNIISKAWSLFMYVGCVTWKIVSYNPCLSFMMGIAFTFLVLVKGKKILGTVQSDDQNKEDTDNESDVDNEIISQESLVEEELSKADDTEKPVSAIGTNEDVKNEDYASVSSAGTKKEQASVSSAGTSKGQASHVTDVSGKKRRSSKNEKLMNDLLSIKESGEKLEKQVMELFNELAGLKNEVAEIRDNAGVKDNEFYTQLDNALNQIKSQGNEFLSKSEDYTKVIEKLESDINIKITNTENLKQSFNGFPTEEDVVKWLHSSLCPLVESDKDLYTSQTPRERRCFSIISHSPLARDVSCKFSDMIVTLDNN